MNSLKKEYNEKIIKKLKKELKILNDSAVPNLKKIVVNIGLGEVVTNKESLEKASEDLATITGQRPLTTKAKRAISNFKIREGMDIGLKVTLRGGRMWDFYQKLVSIVLPRIKDFRGVYSGSFDGNGNFSIGIREHTVFPEIDPNKIDKLRSLEITIVTSAKDDRSGLVLLRALGMPFAKESEARAIERMKDMMRKERKEQAKLKAQRTAEGKDIAERRAAEGKEIVERREEE